MEEKSTGMLAGLAFLMIVLAGANMAFNYFILAQKIEQNRIETEYKQYGGKDNYQKAMILQAAQTTAQLETQFPGKSVKEVQEMIDAELKKIKAPQQNSNPQASQESQSSNKISMSDLVLNTPIYGKKDAPFSILEFGDLECPACQQFDNSGLVKTFVKDHADEVNYIYKNFQFHSGAPMKGEAALCVNELKGGDAFYKYIQSHFESDNIRADKDEMIARAVALGVDKTKMTQCLDSGKYKSVIESDKAQGDKLFNVSGTPTVIVINNKTGEWRQLQRRTADELQKLIDAVK